MQQPQNAGTSAAPAQSTMVAPAPNSGASAKNGAEWQATQAEKITDIASIQPTLANIEEEKINLAPAVRAGCSNVANATQKTVKKFCGPDTTVS